MDKVLVINLTTITQHVGVIHEDGRKDDVQIVPRRRVELRSGMTVDPAWLGRNPGCVRVVTPQVVSPTVIAARKPDPVIPQTLTVGNLSSNGDADDQLTVADLEDTQASDTEGEAQ